MLAATSGCQRIQHNYSSAFIQTKSPAHLPGLFRVSRRSLLSFGEQAAR